VPIDQHYRNPFKIQKAVLKGKMMENYFRPKRAHIVLTSNEENTSTKMSLCNCRCTCKEKDPSKSITPGCNINLDDVGLLLLFNILICYQVCASDKEALPNKYMHGLLHCIEDNHQSVELIERLPNNKYDKVTY
jgi:hypothetical protein